MFGVKRLFGFVKKVLLLCVVVIMLFSVCSCHFLLASMKIHVSDADQGASPADESIPEHTVAFPYSLQVAFNYPSYDNDVYESERLDGESYVECSKRYHSKHNQDYVNRIDTKDYEVFVSSYTPFVFITLPEGTSFEDAYNYALKLGAKSFVSGIWISGSDAAAPD